MTENIAKRYYNRILKDWLCQLQVLVTCTVLLLSFGFYLGLSGEVAFNKQKTAEEIVPSLEEKIFADGYHVRSGLKEGKHVLLVAQTCTSCHSAKLIIQNRADRTGWEGMIKWMQKTQNLQNLGTDEAKILDYLSANYSPGKQVRRANLVVEEWYELE